MAFFGEPSGLGAGAVRKGWSALWQERPKARRARCKCPCRGLGLSAGPSSMRFTCSWRRLVRAWPSSNAMAITQIHTHRRNRHGSWRDGEGGALDAPRPWTLDWMEAPTQRRRQRAAKATTSRLGAICTAGLRTAPLDDGSLSTPAIAAGRNAVALSLPVDSARPRIFASTPQRHTHPRTASMAHSQA